METTYTKGNLEVRLSTTKPFKIQTIDKNLNVVFEREFPCYSSADKTAEETLNAVNMPIKDRLLYKEANYRALADEKIRAAAPELLEILITLLDEPRIKESAILSGTHSILNDNIKIAKKIIKKVTE